MEMKAHLNFQNFNIDISMLRVPVPTKEVSSVILIFEEHFERDKRLSKAIFALPNQINFVYYFMGIRN